MSALHWAVDGGHEGVVYYALNEGVKACTCTIVCACLFLVSAIACVFVQVNEVSKSTIAQYTPLLKAGEPVHVG